MEGKEYRVKDQKFGELTVSIAETHEALGVAAADEFARAGTEALAAKDEIAIIMALGAAEEPFFAALRVREDIDWSRITILHVDTYMGIGDERPESGAFRMRKHLLDHVKPKAFLPMRGDHTPVEEELRRYSDIVRDLEPVICVVGIGESGHLAFNDPPADFDTKDLVRVVAINDVTRNQIFKAGIFSDFDQIPRFGLSLTMYALLRPKTVLALVDEEDKAAIVKELLEGPITMMCPASLLQRHANAHLYLSEEAASALGPE